MRGLAALLVVGAGACFPLPEPEPELEVEACRYYRSCEPTFGAAFPSLDACVDVLRRESGGLDLCGAGPSVQEDCTEQLLEAQQTCEPLDRGACGALLACAEVDCQAQIQRRLLECDVEVAVDGSFLLAVCGAGDPQCFANCVSSASCPTLEDFSDDLVVICLSDCEFF